MGDNEWLKYQIDKGIISVGRDGTISLSLLKMAQCEEGRERLQKLINETRIK